MAFTKSLVAAALVLAFSAAQAQTAPSTATTGTMVIVPAFGEVKHANDEATITFAVEEHAGGSVEELCLWPDHRVRWGGIGDRRVDGRAVHPTNMCAVEKPVAHTS